MTRVVVGIANQDISTELSVMLKEIDNVELAYVAGSTQELVDFCLRMPVDLVFVHEDLGPDPVPAVIRDLSLRRPGMASVLVSAATDPDTVMTALNAGARGVVDHPFSFDQLIARVAAASEWSSQVGRMLMGGVQDSNFGSGKMFAIVGGKGGVGTTTLATHLAMDLHRELPSAKTCLVDLDLEKGDVSSLLDIRHTVSIADVAKVHQDLSSETVSDATLVHDSGLRVLLAPTDVREIDEVSPEALRAIFSILRREYDYIIVDGGARVTPAQAALVESADEVVAVVTADVVCMRSLRQRYTAWELLGVREESTTAVVINQHDRTHLFPAAAVEKLTRARVFNTVFPSMFRHLEPGVNSRDPREVSETSWWRQIRKFGSELGVGAHVERVEAGGAPSSNGASRARTRSEVKGKGRAKRGLFGKRAAPAADVDDVVAAATDDKQKSELGQAVIENVALLPIILGVVLLTWQMAVTGMTAIYSGNAVDIAARGVSLGQPMPEVIAKTRQSVPSAWRSGVLVSRGPDAVTVSIPIPVGHPMWGSFPTRLSSTSSVVEEP